ncbi:MAG TPA: WbuC family cupin fold metalloprotein [Nitrospirota bacterium]
MKQIDSALLDVLTRKAKESPRKRMNFNLHQETTDPVQRLCNAIEPETYIRPHRHAEPATSEVFLLLRGSAVLLLFDGSGRVTEQAVLSPRGPLFAVEIPAGTWHAMASLESETVFFEVKRGPYVPPTGGNVAAWAPPEGDPATARFVEWFRRAKAGDAPPAT